jgi:hypothetical protein
MWQRTSIVIASILKPVDDTRMLEKFGLSLGQTNKYEVNIIGFAAKNLKKFDNIHFHPLFHFRRISFLRLLAPIRLFFYLFKVKPSVAIFNTPEIQYVMMFYKLISGCRIIYDIQENYYRNIYFNKNYILPLRFLFANAIRLKEWSGRWFIDRIIFAEEGYKVEMPGLAKRAVVIRNTYKKLDAEGLEDTKSENKRNTDEIKFSNQNTSELNDKASTDELRSNVRVSVGLGNNPKNSNESNLNNHIDDQILNSHHPEEVEFNFDAPNKDGPDTNKLPGIEKISEDYDRGDNPQNTTFLFSGTISDNYGIFTAIDFIDAMHMQDATNKLLIAGFCANQRTFRRLIARIKNKPYIKLIGGDHLIPHQDIIRYIQQADYGLICYEINPSVENCFPTKIFEYMANQLPIIIQNYKPWSSYCLKQKAGIEIDYNNFESELLLGALKSGVFYDSGIPDEVFWNRDEEKLLKLMQDIQT